MITRASDSMRRYVMFLILLTAWWVAGVTASARTEVAITPDPATNLQGTASGNNIQPLESMTDASGLVRFEFLKSSGSTAPAYYANGTNLRLYSGNTFSVEASQQNAIESIVFQSVAYRSSETTLACEVGTIVYDETALTYTWTCADMPLTSVAFSIADTQLRLTGVTVLLADEGVASLSAPTFSQTTGDFSDDFQLAITDNNDPVATIYYTTDGSIPDQSNGAVYTSPITIVTGADVTVKAVAVRGAESSSVATAQFRYVAKYNFSVKVLRPGSLYSYYVSSDSQYGSWNTDHVMRVTEGEQMYISLSFNTSYYCKSVVIDGSPVEELKNNYSFSMPGHDVEVAIDAVFDPSSPSDPTMPEPQPSDTTRTYNLEIVANPSGAGQVYGSGRYAEGTSVSVSQYSNNGYQFTGWTCNGELLGSEGRYYVTMPANDMVLTANYIYSPLSPGDPQPPILRHPLTAIASPAGSGWFSCSASELVSGETYNVNAYPNTGYRLKGWMVNGEAQEETSTTLHGVMTDKGAQVVGLFVFDPSSPGDPNANSYNSETGYLVIDHFVPGELYSVASNLTNGNFDNVSRLIVKGIMNSSDLNSLRRFSNAETIDISRTSGFSTIPAYTFEYVSASTIVLPSTVSALSYSVFVGCNNLSSIVCYATEPPVCDASAFRDFSNMSVCTVYVPAESMALYEDADSWKEFSILPISTDAHVLQVNLPEVCADGRYKNNTIEIVNQSTGVRQKYVVTDRLLYTFNGLQKDEQYNVYLYSQAGLEIGRIEGVFIPDQDIEVAFENLRELYTVGAKVFTPQGDNVTESVTVEWLKPLADGTSTYLRKAVSLGEIPDGQALICRITLPESLGKSYLQPADTMFTVDASNNSCEIQLAELPMVALSGKVLDSEGSVLAGASVAVMQTLNGKFVRTVTTKTDQSGAWSMNVFASDGTRLSYSARECVTRNDTIAHFAEGVASLNVGDVILRSIVGARINYGFTYLSAGAEEADNEYTDYENVSFAVTNLTQRRDHADISVQYPMLVVLDENINAGDKLQITATSRKGAFNPITEVVEIGEGRDGDVVFNIIGKGGIAARFEATDNPAVVGLLYNADGRFVDKGVYADANLSFTELADGTYALVSMGRSSMLNSVQRLDGFSEIGLVEGRDYVVSNVVVEVGKIATVVIPEVPAVDEGLFSYTYDGATSISFNKSSVTTGNYLTWSSKIDFKAVYKPGVSNVALMVDFPEGCDLVAESIVQGSNIMPYTYDGNRLTVQLGDMYASLLRFCVIPTHGGTLNLTGSVSFDYEGKTIIQPLGTASSIIKDLSISVAEVTSSGNFSVSGTSTSRAEVSVYVNGELSSTGVANAKGEWSLSCSLDSPEKYQAYPVYAEIRNSNGTTLQSECRSITYDPSAPLVSKVTMINTAHPASSLNLCDYVTVFDFLNPQTSIDPYWYWPSYPTFTFLIDIDCSDPTLVTDVWLHVFTSSNEVRTLAATYDAAKGSWLVVDDFESNSLPTTVSVSIKDMRFDISSEASYETLIDDYIGDVEIGSTETDEDGNEVTTVVDKNKDPFAEVIVTNTDKTTDELIDDLLAEGYDRDENPEDDDEEVVMMNKDNYDDIAFIMGTRIVRIRIIREENKQTTVQLISSILSNTWRERLNSKRDCDAGVSIDEYAIHYEYLDRYLYTTTSLLVARTVFVNFDLLPPGTVIKWKEILARITRKRRRLVRRSEVTREFILTPIKCPTPPPPPGDPHEPGVGHVMDPSGYVYEAVPANRVEGVQASIYYKETVEDMYGDLHEEVVLWNAEEYAQKNPLFTDENGMYQWDVPQGLWQVKFEKDGYLTAYSEWLPVPPPQLDVNIGIVQNKQPEVTEARAYEEGVEVQFDKFMDLSTLSTDNIFVTANGEKLNGEIHLIDSALADEYASEEDADATRYASRVRFVPEEPLSVTTGEVRVTVSRNVLSYAGIPMTQTFTQVLDVEKEVQAIAADDVKVLYGGEKEVTVYALPYDAAVGRTLRIATSSELIASIDVTEATLDEEGKAVVKVKGDLPGRAQLTFSIDDVTATGDCAVDVVTEIITAEAPKASRASGTAVYRGTKVELTSESKDATIYFTTDGSCPCDENGTRRKYSVPIIINDDTRILAMTSVGTGDDDVSETVEFNYTLKRSDMDFAMEEGWTWISHNFESAIAPSELAADEGVERILSQTQEVVRDPQLGLIGTLGELSALESYKVETSSATARQRLSDVAWNPSTPIAIAPGWNWLGYPVSQTMTVGEAFEPTSAEPLDIVVGQEGFAQFDGESWIGTLETMSPGRGYMYQSQSAKSVVYNTSIVSNAAALHAAGISATLPLVLDIHKYPSVMPVVATLQNADGAALDNEDYQVNAFCGTECRGIGRVVNGLVMMNVYGQANDCITFQVTDANGELSFGNNVSLDFSETVVGDIFNPYAIAVDNHSGIADVRYDGNIKVAVDGDMLRIKGIPADDIDLVEVYDINGQKLIRETRVSESGIRISTLTSGVYVVIVNGNGEYTYHKIAVR